MATAWIDQIFKDIVETIREPLLVLDSDLKVISASRSFFEFFKVKPEETVGKLIYDLGNKQWNITKLRELLEKILPQHTAFDNYEVEHDFPTIGRRIMLLNARQIHRALGKERIILLAIEDVTERIQLKSMLEDSEERFRRLFETANDGILLLEKRELKIRNANPAITSMMGYSHEDCIGNEMRDIGFPNDIGIFQEVMQTLDKDGIIYYKDIPARRKNGQVVDTDIYMVDKASLVQCNIRDVTERKQSEEALRNSETRLRTLVQTIPDLIWLKDTDGVFMDCNAMFERLLGAAKKDIIGKTDYDFVDRELADFFRENDRKAISAGKPCSNEEWLTFAENGYRGLFDTIKTPMLDDSGNLLGVLGISRDISDRKQAEEDVLRLHRQNQTILDTMPASIWFKDKHNRFLRVNKATCEMMGMSAADIEGKHASELFPDWLSEKYYQDDLEVINSAQPKMGIEEQYTNEAGELRWVRTDKIPWYGEQGNVSGLLTFAVDITERKRAEEEKARLEPRLLQAQKMESIGSLAGGIAHDLNNILFPISGLSEMLLDEIPPDNPAHESIEQIHKSAIRGSELVKQILAFSRQSKPQKLPIRIQSVLKEVLKLVRSTIPANIDIKSHINSDCGLVSADPTQVHQIAMNLITNAYHAVEAKGGTIDIELKETVLEKDDLHTILMKPGKYACITISDTGIGIDKTLIDKIFDPYFTTKELGKGTGLGLSVVHGIVKEHGGDIRVYSEVGKGTAFHVYLPLLEDDRNIKAAAGSKKLPTGSESILLVDDEEPIAKMLQMMLERLGYQITVRTSSPDALDAFRGSPLKFDMVISDRGMPNMTGEQLARELISIRPGIPIILCTGFSDENDENQARAMGIKGFLKKPVATGDLATMVRNVLDESKGIRI